MQCLLSPPKKKPKELESCVTAGAYMREIGIRTSNSYPFSKRSVTVGIGAEVHGIVAKTLGPRFVRTLQNPDCSDD